jgi:hypothetical protein
VVDFCIDTCRRQQIVETFNTGIGYNFRTFLPSDLLDFVSKCSEFFFFCICCRGVRVSGDALQM